MLNPGACPGLPTPSVGLNDMRGKRQDKLKTQKATDAHTDSGTRNRGTGHIHGIRDGSVGGFR
jgi:hypothetical protein